MTTRPCRPWLTYRGRPRLYQPWCECGWRGYGWVHTPALAQKDIDRHLLNATRAEKIVIALDRKAVTV